MTKQAMRSLFPLFILALLIVAAPSPAQTLRDLDRGRGRIMLRILEKDLREHYYDPTFHGLDLEVRFKAAGAAIDGGESLGQIFGIIAQALFDLDDSHTFFIPPERPYRIEYGWRAVAIGDRCFILSVQPESDAERKGLRVGDEILELDGFRLTRRGISRFEYLYYLLRPRPGVRITVQRPDGSRQTLDIAAKVHEEKRIVDLTRDDLWTLIREEENEAWLHRHRYYDDIGDALVWQMTGFDLDDHEVDRMFGRATRKKALILDLRGNRGGYEKTLLRVIANLFDHDVTIGEIRRRTETKPLVAKTRRERAFRGKLVVLIDARSGSSAEVLARIVQLEKRGQVIGDRSAGSVMRSRVFSHRVGVNVIVPYGASITDADVIMSDGKSLERTGVMPDELLLPTAEDLAAGRDPVLARAASLAGLDVDATRAGALFPIEWRRKSR